MYCKRCGTFIPDGDRFCTECGYKIGDRPIQSAQRPVRTSGSESERKIDWNSMQPRRRRAPATALIIGVGLLLAASLMLVSGMAFLTPGGLGYVEGEASPGASSRPLATPRPTAVPVSEPGELPADIAAVVNAAAKAGDYVGSFTGTMTVNAYNIDTLVGITGSSGLTEYAAYDGKTYSVTAEYTGSRVKVKSVDFPPAGSGGTVLDTKTNGAPENGRCLTETNQSGKGYDVKNSEQVWFLEDGRLYVINAMTMWKDGEFVGGLVISASLSPVE